MSSRWVHATSSSALSATVLAGCALALCAGLAALACGQAAAPSSELNGATVPSEVSAQEPAEVETPSGTTEAPSGTAPAAAPSGKRAPCTLGANQTCNDDARESALWGRCTELGVCECVPGFVLNQRGRCQPPAP